MLTNQMDRIEKMVWEQGLMSQNQKLAKIMEENKRKNEQFDKWLKTIVRK